MQGQDGLEALRLFREGDVFIDYPFEGVKFRWELETEKLFRHFYGKPEREIPHSSNMFHEAIPCGRQITREEYFSDCAAPET